MSRRLRILGTGKYLPERCVSAAELDARLGLRTGVVARTVGVLERRMAAPSETVSMMGAAAARRALDAAGLEPRDLDAIVFASAVPEQLIPCTASLVQAELGLEDSGIPAFDVNQTCLSWLTALDMLSYAIDAGRFERVLLVSGEIASVGLDWSHLESAGLFGDGAAAAIIGRSAPQDRSEIVSSSIRTYASGREHCRLRGGGTKMFATEFSEERRQEYLFQMDGPKVFRQALEVLPGFVKDVCEKANATLSDVRMVVPHQASRRALEGVREHLGVPPERWMTIVENHGNCIAASIPMALHEGIAQARIERGDLVLLLGTSAGFSIGAMMLRY